jgi:transposase
VRQRPQPDWKTIHEQLQQHLTLQLLWEEYRQANPEGYRYSWFCERYQHWRRHLDVVLRHEHKAGEKMFVDWAGATIPVCDATTGQAWPASLFVSVLGASSYTYAEATRDQQLEAWAMAPLNENERREVWEICEDRYQTRSTVLTSQLPVSRWHEQIGDPTIADGILDRLVHNAHRIEMRGESMRKKGNPPQGEKKE